MGDGPRLGRDYGFLLAGAAASNLGDGVRLAALPLLAVTLTDEPLLVSALSAAVMVPAILLGPIGGVIIDRYPRRRLIVLGQAVRALAVAVFVGVLLVDAMSIWTVYALAIVLGAFEVIVDGSYNAAVPSLAPRSLLERANARMVSAQLVLDQMVGSAAGALLFALRAPLPFVVDGLTYVVGGLIATRISVPMEPERDGAPEAVGSMWSEAMDGFAFIRDTPLLKWFAGAIGVMNLAAATGFSVLVLLVVDELDAPDVAFGLILAAGSVAGVVTSGVIERIIGRVGRRTVFVVAGFTDAVALVVILVALNAATVGVGMALTSAMTVAINVPGRAVRQEVTPDRLLGRVVTSYRVLGYAGIPVGAVLGGLVTDLAGTSRAAFGVGAALSVLAAILLVRATRDLPAPGRNSPEPTDDGWDDAEAWGEAR